MTCNPAAACACCAPRHGLVPAAAFGVFFTDALAITAYTRATDALVSETVAICGASVSDPSTDPIQVGQAPDAWKWTIEFPAESWTATQSPAPGATIAAGTRWPKLYVQESYRLGEIWHLVCSSREGAK